MDKADTNTVGGNTKTPISCAGAVINRNAVWDSPGWTVTRRHPDTRLPRKILSSIQEESPSSDNAKRPREDCPSCRHPNKSRRPDPLSTSTPITKTKSHDQIHPPTDTCCGYFCSEHSHTHTCCGPDCYRYQLHNPQRPLDFPITVAVEEVETYRYI